MKQINAKLFTFNQMPERAVMQVSVSAPSAKTAAMTGIFSILCEVVDLGRSRDPGEAETAAARTTTTTKTTTTTNTTTTTTTKTTTTARARARR